jgi:nitrogenase iron protein NifH
MPLDLLEHRTMQKITIYGKGGVGKSTVASNLAACLQARGQAAALIGCSPKADSTYFLLGEPCRPTILDSLRGGTGLKAVEACVRRDARGIVCLETGGPEPAAGCAGRGVSHALNLLDRSGLLARAGVEWALYDVIADVVCGGFAEPMKRGYGANGAPAQIYIVTSAELMSLYAANNICSAVAAIRREQGIDLRVGGLIHNRRGMEHEDALVERFAGMLSVPVIAALPRTHLVQAAEAQRGLVVERFPESKIARSFAGLAERVLAQEGVQPTPLPPVESIEQLAAMAADLQPADEPRAGRAWDASAGEVNASSPTPSTVRIATSPPRMVTSATRPPRYLPGQPRRIAIYGKAGIGKSTISANLSAALAGLGEQVMQIGCDPKRDSVALLAHRMIPTVLEQMDGRQNGPLPVEAVVYPGYGGVQCVESGGPPAGTGCAGQGVFYALEMLEAADVFARYGITFSVFDILGDVVCGGFAQPIRGGFCREVYVVTNGEPLSLLVSNNILRAVQRMNGEGIPVGVAGLINNRRGVPNEDAVVEAFAAAAGVPVVAHIPRAPLVQAAEARGQTVLEAFPASEQAATYGALAQTILATQAIYTPTPVEDIDAVVNLFEKNIQPGGQQSDPGKAGF